MKYILHVVFGESAKKTLLATSFGQDPIISLNDDLMIGPISNFDDQKKLNQRIKWFKRNIPCAEEATLIQSYINEDFAKLRQILKIISDNRLYIWSGRTTYDRIWTARLISVLPDVQNVFFLDIPEVQILSKNGRYFTPTCLGVLHPDQVYLISKYFKALTKGKSEEWIDLWKYLINLSGTLRISLNRRIKIVKSSFFDETLIDNCKYQFQKSARVVGETLVDINFEARDYFLNWRLIELVKAKKLELKGEPKCMRHYEVKLA